MKSNWNPSSRCRADNCGQTDRPDEGNRYFSGLRETRLKRRFHTHTHTRAGRGGGGVHLHMTENEWQTSSYLAGTRRDPARNISFIPRRRNAILMYDETISDFLLPHITSQCGFKIRSWRHKEVPRIVEASTRTKFDLGCQRRYSGGLRNWL
jgi:hypothetical protein